jgi:hypothetical protein
VLSKNVKIRIYKTMIFPVVLYGYETWPLFTLLPKAERYMQVMLKTAGKLITMQYILVLLFSTNPLCDKAQRILLPSAKAFGKQGRYTNFLQCPLEAARNTKKLVDGDSI